MVETILSVEDQTAGANDGSSISGDCAFEENSFSISTSFPNPGRLLVPLIPLLLFATASVDVAVTADAFDAPTAGIVTLDDRWSRGIGDAPLSLSGARALALATMASAEERRAQASQTEALLAAALYPLDAQP